MTYTVQKWGHDGLRGRWFRVGDYVNRAEAIHAAGMFQWASNATHRVIDDTERIVWPVDFAGGGTP